MNPRCLTEPYQRAQDFADLSTKSRLDECVDLNQNADGYPGALVLSIALGA